MFHIMSSSVRITALLLHHSRREKKLSEDEDVGRGKVLKHPEISTDSDRASSPNPCSPLELCETMTGIWEVALPGVVYGEPDRAQIIITSPPDRKSFPSSGS